MKSGFYKICINPPMDTPILGYYKKRFTKGIADDIFVRACVFDDGVKKAAVISLDVCMVPQEYFDKMKQAICSAIQIEKQGIFITCSHTHTGPLLGKDFASDLVSDKKYDEFFINSVAECVAKAFLDLKETTIEIAQGEAKGISFVRRFRMKDGSVATNPGVNNAQIDHPLGKPNETVKLIKLVRKDADDVLIVNFGTHPDTVGGEYISADYIGYVCSILEGAIKNTKCIFLLGAQGDVNHVNVAPTQAESAISQIDFDSVPRGLKHTEYMGRVIAGAVLSICSITQKIDAEKIAYLDKTVYFPANREPERYDEAKHITALYDAGRDNELPYKEMELTTAVAEARRIVALEENGPEQFPFHLSAISIGELVFAGLGGEPFTQIGERICQNSPFKQTVISVLTNNEGGYVPTKDAYDEGGYEARSSAFKRGCDDIVVDGMLEVLNRIK